MPRDIRIVTDVDGCPDGVRVQHYKAGTEVHDMPDSLADILIDQGKAVPTGEPDPVESLPRAVQENLSKRPGPGGEHAPDLGPEDGTVAGGRPEDGTPPREQTEPDPTKREARESAPPEEENLAGADGKTEPIAPKGETGAGKKPGGK